MPIDRLLPVLRRTVFLGLTLPQIAAAGVSFTFWLQQSGFLPQWQQSERGMGMFGSLLFTFLGMGILGYLEQRGKASRKVASPLPMLLREG